MKIKTFYAKNMQAALRSIKEQLGPDALILSSREFPPAGPGRASNGFEVVAAVDDEGLAQHGSGADGVILSAGRRATGSGGARIFCPEDTYAFSRRGVPSALDAGEPIAAAPRNLARSDRSGEQAIIAERPSILDDAPVQEYHRLLLSKEIMEPLASQLLEEACSSLPPEDRVSIPTLQRAVASAACSRIARSVTPDGLPGRRVVIFIGPTGVGKTTSLAKLAARLALKHRKRVTLL